MALFSVAEWSVSFFFWKISPGPPLSPRLFPKKKKSTLSLASQNFFFSVRRRQGFLFLFWVGDFFVQVAGTFFLAPQEGGFFSPPFFFLNLAP